MVPATEAAVALRLTREQVVRRIQAGQLIGRKDSKLGWVVDRKELRPVRKACAA